MNGFLFDENLPVNIEFSPALKVKHVTSLKPSTTDTEIWEYTSKNHLVIVTKDADFSDRMIVSNPPPKVIHLKFGNMKKKRIPFISQKKSGLESSR